MDSKLTYISLFSSAGIGCYGFKMNDFECIATNELIERRIDVQRINNKCKYQTGYLCGDITSDEMKSKLFDEVDRWRKYEGINDVTTIIATPPCQGMSVANHKKTQNEIVRNSLVVESIKIVSKVSPLFFVFENVPKFMSTLCTDIDGEERPIADVIQLRLGEEYSIYSQVINFKNYGACSSRSRTLVIGVRRDLADFISPIELFPDFCEEKTLRDTIGNLKPLKEFGEIDENDIYHAFRTYPESMRSWIADLKEGESAFDNEDISKKPHQIIDGKIVVNKQKNGDKYRRQYWDKVGPCIHTRNDQLASQNTVHPSDDRVFSIRELMLMMTIPSDFKWTDKSFDELNQMSLKEKMAFLKKEEIKIRQCLGEAVPTAIMKSISLKMKSFLSVKHLNTTGVKQLIDKEKLTDFNSVVAFIRENTKSFGFSTLSRIAEYSNAQRENYAAFFTDKHILTEIYKRLPELSKTTIRVLEPSVGAGNFLPFIIKKYSYAEHLYIDVIDIDGNAISTLKELVNSLSVPDNVTIRYLNDDFLLHSFDSRYDLVVGNPPFNKLSTTEKLLVQYRRDCYNQETLNTASFFLEKAIKLADWVSFVMPKFLLNTPEYSKTRELLATKKVDSIIDFGEDGFKGVLVETVNIVINTLETGSVTFVQSLPQNIAIHQKQKYIFDKAYPYWIIYRNSFFDTVAQKLLFNSFSVFRDRQITNKLLNDSEGIRVIKSRNIDDTGANIVSLKGYDAYISSSEAEKLSVYKYYDRDDVYLTPNMTYKPRVIKKPKATLVNGSVAILLPTNGRVLTDRQLSYFSSEEYRSFYILARNYQTRSLNVDSCSVFFFGILKED